jgi:hypothetical protein
MVKSLCEAPMQAFGYRQHIQYSRRTCQVEPYTPPQTQKTISAAEKKRETETDKKEEDNYTSTVWRTHYEKAHRVIEWKKSKAIINA